MKHVAILAHHGCWAMSVFAVTDFFKVVSLLERHLGLTPSYTLDIVSVAMQRVTTASGHHIEPTADLNLHHHYDVVIVPSIEGPCLNPFRPDPQVIVWLTQHLQANADIIAMTTGIAFVAHTGLANGLMLATHWAYTRQLSKLYPHCQFVAHKSFLQTQHLYSVGSLAGYFDALLAIVARDKGDQFSQWCATHLLVSDPYKLNPMLSGYRNHLDDGILKLQDWLEAHYTETTTIEWMAQKIGMSERTLKRRFKSATGIAPNEYVQKVRIDKAKKLLLATTLSIKEIAYEVGYENVSFFVRIFKRDMGQTPAQWRHLT